MSSHPNAPLQLDIFCRVIDNFGDAGVCWRLAQRLATDFAWQVRLLIDAPAALSGLAPNPVAGIAVLDWAQAETIQPAQCVIEAFACDPPAAYVRRMSQASPAPVWLNLEYLSLEAFTISCHGLPSPQTNGLCKYFFFPGVDPASGGLLRSPPVAPRPVDPKRLSILLFCYPYAPAQALLSALQDHPAASMVRLAAGILPNQINRDPPSAHSQIKRLAFLPQTDFDQQIAASDLAFVRGEDSITRALLAGIPFVWNIYHQDQAAHLPKLAALLDWWCHGLDPAAADALRQLHAVWNHDQSQPAPSLAAPLAAGLAFLPQLRSQAIKIATQLHQQPDLGQRLVDFVQKKLN